MKPFSFFCNTRIIFNENLEESLQAVKSFIGGEKAFIVTDPVMRELPVFETLTKTLEETGFQYEIHSDVRPNPTDVSITACAKQFTSSDADFVLAFGGGSSIDTAKAAAIMKRGGGKIEDYYGVDQVAFDPYPVVAIPTTAGSGAEVSEFIALTKEAVHQKAQIWSVKACPSHAVLWPEVLVGSPAKVAVSAGFDALAHAVESYISIKANPITEPYALTAVGLLAGSIDGFVKDTSDRTLASNMLIGCTMAMMSSGRVGNSDGHVLARSMQGVLDITHGQAVGMALPLALAFNVDAAREKLAKCARETGIDTSAMTAEEAAKAFVLKIQDIRDDIGIAKKLSDLGVDNVSNEQMDRLVESAMLFSSEGSDANSQPRKASAEEYRQMFQDCVDGRKIVL